MKRMAWPIVAMALSIGAPTAAAADKAHQQLLAEIRMMQEQQQQLQQMVGGLADTLKSMTAKIDDQTQASRKGFADQKVLIDGVADGVRVLREKADDTNVRLSSMTQELESLRQTIASMPSTTSATAPVTEPPAGSAPYPPPGAGGAAAPPLVSVPAQGGTPNVSPQRMFDNAFADYMAGQYDLAVLGFETYIKMFPRTDRTDDAQLNIGNALLGAKKYPDAVTAYQKVISDYPQGDAVPQAYYKLGQTYETLKQPDLAKKAYETVVQKYPTDTNATLAKTRLDGLNRK